MATLPVVAVTGAVIEATWGNAARTALTENPAYLAEAAGDLFRATGAGAVERFASLGPGILASPGPGALPAWTTGSAGQFLRVNGAGDGVEFTTNPSGLELIASGLSTSNNVNISSLPGFHRYLLVFDQEEAAASYAPFLRVNGLTSDYRHAYSYYQSAVTNGSASSQNAFTIAAGPPGAGVNTDIVLRATVFLEVVEDNAVLRSDFFSQQTNSAGQFGLGTYAGSRPAVASLTSVSLHWSFSAFGSDPHARYALYALR